jgi:AmiR/NasT family two-component response regulator
MGSIAVSNAHTLTSTAERAEQLRTAMASRATIEQAKGIIMAQSGLSPDEAFAVLVRALAAGEQEAAGHCG